MATGLASLDFELPTRGLLYRFTVPRGQSQITARAFSRDLLQRLIEIAAAAVVAIIAWLAVRRIDRGSFAWLAKPAGSTLLVCLGLLSLCGGLLPLVGLVAVVAGCGLKVHRRWCVRTAVSRPALWAIHGVPGGSPSPRRPRPRRPATGPRRPLSRRTRLGGSAGRAS